MERFIDDFVLPSSFSSSFSFSHPLLPIIIFINHQPRPETYSIWIGLRGILRRVFIFPDPVHGLIISLLKFFQAFGIVGFMGFRLEEMKRGEGEEGG